MIEIVPLRGDHLEEVVAIEEQVYPMPWKLQTFTEEITAPHRTYLVALAGGEVVGYAGMMLSEDEAHVTTVVTSPKHRQKGVATRLMLCLAFQAVEGGARSLTLEVRTSNQAAQALYRRFGMAPVGIRKNYYVSEDALIMWVHDLNSPQYRQRLNAMAADLQ